MGSIYGFWRQLNKEQKQAKMRYIDMFYSLLFRKLVSIGDLNLMILSLSVLLSTLNPVAGEERSNP